MVDPAVFEISGHIVLKRQEDYEKATQAWAWRLLEFASLSEARFAEVTALALGETK
jgi:GDP-L-galactose phosphorylase